MAQKSYAYACARVSALSKRLLDDTALKRMTEGSMGDALRILIDDRYGNLPDAGEGDGEKMIERELIAMREEIKSLSPEPAITDLFLLQSDVMNLKTLIKARLLDQKDVTWQAGGLYEREALEKAVSEQDYSLLPADMVPELTALEKRLATSVEPQLISIALDRAYLRHALKTTERNKAFSHYFKAKADFDNVLTFLRVRAMGGGRGMLRDVLLVEGGIPFKALYEGYDLSVEGFGKIVESSVCRRPLAAALDHMYGTGNIGEVEKARDNYLMSLISAHRHDAMSLYPVVGYILAKEREAQNVRLILTVKRNGLNESVIAERLVKLYG
ncbi:MAG: V-type ATPase subunit [Clostridia bacterium]|nr:V-type ATPase subunit [Clostridia bacterium]MBR0207244.1 V-type ATPase subunit [Clostridia bacterium]